jgi:hypothetical protein
MEDLFKTLPWFAVVISFVIVNSLNNDKISLEKANEKLMNDKIKIESINENLKEQNTICISELKGYSNGSK